MALADASLPGRTIDYARSSRDSTLVCLIERIYAGLTNLFVDGGGGATDTDGGNALAFDGERDAAFDADEPSGADSQSLRENLVIGNLAAFPVGLAGCRCGQRGRAGFGKRDHGVVGPSVCHSLERKKVPTTIDDCYTDDLFELFGFVDGRINNGVGAFLS